MLSISYTLIAFAGVCVGISLCGLVGNGVVMWFLGFHTKQSPFTVYILNLAVADFLLLLLLFLLVSAFLTLAAFCTSLFHLVPLYLDFIFAVELLCHVLDLSSLGLLSALSVERCISVLCPIWYRCHRPRHLSGIVSGILWALAGVLVSCLYLSIAENSDTVLAGVALVISLILSVVMLVSNLVLFLKLRKLFVAILLNVLVFFAFGIPFCVEVFFNLPDSGELFPENTSLLLAMLNCTLNPVIYVLVGSCRRRRFQLLLLGATLDMNNEDCAGNDHGCSREEEAEGAHGDESHPAVLVLL
uniref:G-protein coupled receptors family 1 profile domain-containing protein n=1 Tax=Malurus cyaneus samueli TaxID=2593467 RepID=A0A8C5TT60_9PASS